MAISPERAQRFSRKSEKVMLDWLIVAAERSSTGENAITIFSPFELFLFQADTPAQAVAWGVDELTANGKMKFRNALAKLVNVLEPDYPERWLFAIELIWRTDAYPAVDQIEKRFNSAFIERMYETSPDDFEVMMDFLRNANFSDASPVVRLLRRVAVSRHFNSDYAGLWLLRLCEIDPDNWTEHIAVMRDLVHALMTDIRLKEKDGYEAMIQAQNNVAANIYAAIGFSRFRAGLMNIACITDAPYYVPSDNWFWRSLVERQKLVLVSPDGRIAPRDNPSNREEVEDALLPTYELRHHRITVAPTFVEDALGPTPSEFREVELAT